VLGSWLLRKQALAGKLLRKQVLAGNPLTSRVLASKPQALAGTLLRKQVLAGKLLMKQVLADTPLTSRVLASKSLKWWVLANSLRRKKVRARKPHGVQAQARKLPAKVEQERQQQSSARKG
jgi:hypothetical protein